jgi:nicotinate-nucleotide pyrophosphorylase (carboxylating)
MFMNPIWLTDLVKRALDEDIGYGDITTEAIVDPQTLAKAVITAKEAGRIAGLDVAALVFRLLDETIQFQPETVDGAEVAAGGVLAIISGRAAPLLLGERVALNFLQRMSGIATETARAVKEAVPYGARIVDTRKTTPTLRALEKYAVRMGGGFNHRFGLDDAVLIKENHIAVAGGVQQAVFMVRRRLGHMVKIEVEAERLHQVSDALEAGVDAILLDNMDLQTMRAAVQIVRSEKGKEIAKGRLPLLEASGDISVSNVPAVAATGVDIISMGKLTRSAPSLDLSLRLHML